MQKVLKKIVSILFTLVLISSIGIVSSFAYQVPQNSETAVLKGNEHYSCSGTVDCDAISISFRNDPIICIRTVTD